MVSSEGTAIVEAIRLSKSYFDDTNQKNKILFLVSDGEDTKEIYQNSKEAASKESGYIHRRRTREGGPILFEETEFFNMSS